MSSDLATFTRTSANRIAKAVIAVEGMKTRKGAGGMDATTRREEVGGGSSLPIGQYAGQVFMMTADNVAGWS